MADEEKPSPLELVIRSIANARKLLASMSGPMRVETSVEHDTLLAIHYAEEHLTKAHTVLRLALRAKTVPVLQKVP